MKSLEKSDLNILICYKNFGAFQGISHIGLGVSALNNCKNLNQMGIRAQVMPLKEPADLVNALKQNPNVTHVTISAPWIPTDVLSSLCAYYPDTQFAVVSHSNTGFLQADRNGIRLIKEAIELEGATFNFHVAGNCTQFVGWMEETFKEPCTYLPNMYFLHNRHGARKELWDGGLLRIGIFGATRSLKNFVSASAAAMEIATNVGVQTEIWINSGREDGPESKVIRGAITELVAGMPNIELKLANWASWSAFKKLIGTMNLLLQPSYSESFNMVTADGIAMGVPSVVSEAISWAPRSWKAETDDVNDIARVGLALLGDPGASRVGLHALKHYIRAGRASWLEYLTQNKFGNTL